MSEEKPKQEKDLSRRLGKTFGRDAKPRLFINLKKTSDVETTPDAINRALKRKKETLT